MRLPTRLAPAAILTLAAGAVGQDDFDAHAAIETYLDRRGLPTEAAAAATKTLVRKLTSAKLDATAVEEILRAPRQTWLKPEAVTPGKLGNRLFSLQTEQVDYRTTYFLYVPKSYDKKQAARLLLVAHGGNGAMLIRRAAGAAYMGLRVWIKQAEKHGFLLAAPITQRGWGQIGNAVVFSLLSKLQRTYHIDPDRIYVTGHSMGGHMSWRSALGLTDRWGAVAPMSGGYDFVKNKAIYNLFNLAGYATYCQREPYGIDRDNKTNAAWLKAHGFDWVSVQRPGTHTIPMGDLPKIAKFFIDRPRNMYPKRVYVRRGGRMKVDTAPDAAATKKRNWARTEGFKGPHTWNKDRPLDYSTMFWVRLHPREPLTEAVDGKPQTIVQTVYAENKGDNTLSLSTRGVRKITLYLHPQMVDLQQPVRVFVNGKKRHDKVVEPSLVTMLELVREFDDRGRIFYAQIDLTIDDDVEVAVPKR